MIEFERYELANGLKIIVHEDNSTPMVAVNLLYQVGSRDETPEKTGFAHLFEHLMFGGSANIPYFDEPLQWAGGDSNAFTNTDITNYYEILPAENLETAFWLESDRMMSLNISKKALKVQKKVVMEEFRETCLNEPYGDAWHHLMDLAYKVHPYRWPVIGKELDHIKDATLEDVQGFFTQYYRPNNAILVVAGDVKPNEVKELAEKWFLEIPGGPKLKRNLPIEPLQTAPGRKVIEAKVPVDAFFMAFHMPSRSHEDYYKVDLLSDVLCNGNSSRLYQRLKKEKELFSQIDAYVTGVVDCGLLIIEGRPSAGVSIETARNAVWEELEALKTELIGEPELRKLKNKVESTLVFSEAGVLNKAMNLAFFEMLGDASKINGETELYEAVTVQDINDQANIIFQPNNCSELFYRAKKE